MRHGICIISQYDFFLITKDIYVDYNTWILIVSCSYFGERKEECLNRVNKIMAKNLTSMHLLLTNLCIIITINVGLVFYILTMHSLILRILVPHIVMQMTEIIGTIPQHLNWSSSTAQLSLDCRRIITQQRHKYKPRIQFLNYNIQHVRISLLIQIYF